MCIGNKMPPPPKPQPPSPSVKAAAPPPEYVSPEQIKGKETGEDDEKLSTKKKKALEIKAAKEGVKQFSAIDPSAGTNLPETPSGGTNI